MKSYAKTFAVLGVAVCLYCSPAFVGTAHASKPIITTFTLTPEEVQMDFHPLPSGGLKVDIIYVRHAVTGDWVGQWEHSGFVNQNPDGIFFASGFATFTGTIAGREGTVDIMIYTKGYMPPDGSPPTASSKFTILQGTGGLANLHGEGTDDNSGLNTALIHFDP